MYNLGHVFKIICKLDNNNICYIGSTFDELRKKWYKHKLDYKFNKGKFTIHKYFDKYGIDNFQMIKIKSYLCFQANKRDCKHLNVYETLWILKHSKNCINTKLPYTPMRYMNDKLCRSNWRDKNKKRLLDYQKAYNKIRVQCSCGITLNQGSLIPHKKTKKHLKHLILN